jgi:RimJ/RimL family protein N-acetyltransferase
MSASVSVFWSAYDMAVEIFQTDRLSLRQYTIEDEGALFQVFADPYARSFYPEMVDPLRVRAWIEWNLKNYDEFGFGLWAMELTVDRRFIGDCGLTYQDVEGRRELEIGYHLLESERGKGYATEAALTASISASAARRATVSARSFDRQIRHLALWPRGFTRHVGSS